MLAYAAKLTLEPQGMTEDDVSALREVGFDDTAVLDICQVVAYYNYVNRLADGLGVELEDSWTPEEMTITREEFLDMKTRKGITPVATESEGA